MSVDIPVGTTVYQENHSGISIAGFSYTENNIEQSAQTIADICFDSAGNERFKNYMLSLNDTGFTPTNILPNIKDWQVGEGFAEAYITAHFSCFFPWSNSRDLKNPNSSLTGADMVGFHQGQFAFGEVKTSAEKKHPPQVTYKKGDGLNAQLNKLCADHELRWVLIQYLFHRQNSSAEYKEACIAYLKNNNNFYIFGVLVRCTNPEIKDWNYLKKHLNPHENNKIYLVALYLPLNDGIEKLHTCVLSKKDKS
jgi:hypothetical protein